MAYLGHSDAEEGEVDEFVIQAGPSRAPLPPPAKARPSRSPNRKASAMAGLSRSPVLKPSPIAGSSRLPDISLPPRPRIDVRGPNAILDAISPSKPIPAPLGLGLPSKPKPSKPGPSTTELSKPPLTKKTSWSPTKPPASLPPIKLPAAVASSSTLRVGFPSLDSSKPRRSPSPPRRRSRSRSQPRSQSKKAPSGSQETQGRESRQSDWVKEQPRQTSGMGWVPPGHHDRNSGREAEERYDEYDNRGRNHGEYVGLRSYRRNPDQGGGLPYEETPRSGTRPRSDYHDREYDDDYRHPRSDRRHDERADDHQDRRNHREDRYHRSGPSTSGAAAPGRTEKDTWVPNYGDEDISRSQARSGGERTGHRDEGDGRMRDKDRDRDRNRFRESDRDREREREKKLPREDEKRREDGHSGKGHTRYGSDLRAKDSTDKSGRDLRDGKPGSPPHHPRSPSAGRSEGGKRGASHHRPTPSVSPRPPTPPGDSNTRPKQIKRHTVHRPAVDPKPQTPQPPPPPSHPKSPEGQPPTPPGGPPPPPSHTPPPPPPPPESSINPYAYDPPVHKGVESIRSRPPTDIPNGNGNGVHSSAGSNYRPNRDVTRHSTPVPPIRHDKHKFTMWPEKKEKEKLGRIFEGTTTLEDYDLGTKLGEGTFGVVTKATEKVGGAVVALKKLITHNPRDGVSVTTVREIRILKALEHENVVPIRAMVVNRKHPNDRSDRGDVFMVFPYMDHDLCGLLANKAFSITVTIAKTLLRQLLEGLAYIHGQNIIHRDIKTANILVDRMGRVMIADFGLARGWTSKGSMPPHMENEYTNMVVTRWYRAPELLLGSTKYGPEIDLWSTGCVFGEMFSRNPIICGESDRDQLYKIVTRCGPLDEESFPGWSDLPGFPDSKGHPWDQMLLDKPLLDQMYSDHNMSRAALDLLGGLLRLNPAKRLSANEALDHGWFWSAPLPEKPKPGMITVDSSHEFTTRRPEKPVQVQVPISHNRAARPQPPHAGFNARPQGMGQAYNARQPGLPQQQQMSMQGMGMGGGMGANPGMAYGQAIQGHVPYQTQPVYNPHANQQHQYQPSQPPQQQNPYLPQHNQNQPNFPNHQNGHGNGYAGASHSGSQYNHHQSQPALAPNGYPPGMPPSLPHPSNGHSTNRANVPQAPFGLAGPSSNHALPSRPGVAPPLGFKLAPTAGAGSQSGYANGSGGMGGHLRPGDHKRPPSGPADPSGRGEKRPRTQVDALPYQ